jgi:hypothetical protein
MQMGSLCPNFCLYCYVGPIFNHYGWTDIGKIVTEIEDKGIAMISGYNNLSYEAKAVKRNIFTIDQERMQDTWGKQGLRKLFMSPTSHDIFPENVDFLIQKWSQLLEAGHSLLIVSKPILSCIASITHKLQRFKDRVNIRFTVTSDCNSNLSRWETFATPFEDRFEAIKLAKSEGYGVSISIEPFLSDPRPLVAKLTPFVDEMWIGMMNGFPSEKMYGKSFCSELKTEIQRVKALYSFDKINSLVQELRSNPKIQWKESFLKIFLKNTQGEK